MDELELPAETQYSLPPGMTLAPSPYEAPVDQTTIALPPGANVVPPISMADLSPEYLTGQGYKLRPSPNAPTSDELLADHYQQGMVEPLPGDPLIRAHDHTMSELGSDAFLQQHYGLPTADGTSSRGFNGDQSINQAAEDIGNTYEKLMRGEGATDDDLKVVVPRVKAEIKRRMRELAIQNLANTQPRSWIEDPLWEKQPFFGDIRARIRNQKSQNAQDAINAGQGTMNDYLQTASEFRRQTEDENRGMAGKVGLALLGAGKTVSEFGMLGAPAKLLGAGTGANFIEKAATSGFGYTAANFPLTGMQDLIAGKPLTEVAKEEAGQFFDNALMAGVGGLGQFKNLPGGLRNKGKELAWETIKLLASGDVSQDAKKIMGLTEEAGPMTRMLGAAAEGDKRKLSDAFADLWQGQGALAVINGAMHVVASGGKADPKALADKALSHESLGPESQASDGHVDRLMQEAQEKTAPPESPREMADRLERTSRSLRKQMTDAGMKPPEINARLRDLEQQLDRARSLASDIDSRQTKAEPSQETAPNVPGPPISTEGGPEPALKPDVARLFPESKETTNANYPGAREMQIGGRSVFLTHDPGRNSVKVDFELPRGKMQGVSREGLQAGTLSLGRGLLDIAGKAKQAGMGITFETNPRRAEAYGEGLKRAGFALEGEPEAIKGQPNKQRFTFRPAPDPLVSPYAKLPPAEREAQQKFRADQVQKNHNDTLADRNGLRRQAWQALKEHGVDAKSYKKKYEDASKVPGLDEVAGKLAEDRPDLLKKEGQEPSDVLHGMLRDGLEKPMTRAEAMQEAEAQLATEITPEERNGVKTAFQREGLPAAKAEEHARRIETEADREEAIREAEAGSAKEPGPGEPSPGSSPTEIESGVAFRREPGPRAPGVSGRVRNALKGFLGDEAGSVDLSLWEHADKERKPEEEKPERDLVKRMRSKQPSLPGGQPLGRQVIHSEQFPAPVEKPRWTQGGKAGLAPGERVAGQPTIEAVVSKLEEAGKQAQAVQAQLIASQKETPPGQTAPEPPLSAKDWRQNVVRLHARSYLKAMGEAIREPSAENLGKAGDVLEHFQRMAKARGLDAGEMVRKEMPELAKLLEQNHDLIDHLLSQHLPHNQEVKDAIRLAERSAPDPSSLRRGVESSLQGAESAARSHAPTQEPAHGNDQAGSGPAQTPGGAPADRTGAEATPSSGGPASRNKLTPGGALAKFGGLHGIFGDTTVHVSPSPDKPDVAFITGLTGKNLAEAVPELAQALKDAGFRDVDYRIDNEDGRGAARARLLEPQIARIRSLLAGRGQADSNKLGLALWDLANAEGGAVDLDKLKEKAASAARYTKDAMGRFAGKMVPTITRFGRKAGEAVADLIGSRHFAKIASEHYGDTVLGRKSTPEFDRLVGSTLLESRMRHARVQFLRNGRPEDARNVRTLLGAQNSPFQSEADYQAALKNPEVQAALDRYEKHYVPEKERMFRDAQGLDENDPISSLTQIPGRPVSALAMREGDTETPGTAWLPGRGSPKNLKLYGNERAMQASLSAGGYETDLRKIIENDFARGYPLAAKAKMYRTLEEHGIGKWAPQGKEQGYTEMPFTTPPKGTQNAEPGDVFHVKDEAAGELHNALNIDKTQDYAKVLSAMNWLPNQAALASSVEAASHTVNLATALFTKPGVRLGDVFHNAYQRIMDYPAFRERMMELARINAMKPPGMESGKILPQKYRYADPTFYAGKILDGMSDVVRMTLSDAFDRMAGKGMIKEADATAKRDFINQSTGQYMKEAQNGLVRWFRDTGFGPFATAGTTFNVQGLKSLGLGTNLKAADMGSAIRMRMEVFAKMAAVLGGVAAYNYFKHGNPLGSQNNPFLNLLLKDEDGKTASIDVSPLILAKRGLRVLGILGYVEGQRQNKSEGVSEDKAIGQFLRSIAHPFMGPAVSLATTTLTGENMFGQKIADTAKKGQSQMLLNAKAAIMNANPAVAALTGADETPRRRKQGSPTDPDRLMKLLGPFGVQYRNAPSRRGRR